MHVGPVMGQMLRTINSPGSDFKNKSPSAACLQLPPECYIIIVLFYVYLCKVEICII